ncbi:MAG: GNAT family N-acetyltransferase [Phycisphaerales bacterium]|nr:GNAT family N-acetyltransferase [Phycisphaerales bacterium]
MTPNSPRHTRIELRPVSRDDLDEFYAFETDPESAALAGVKPRGRVAFFAHWETIATDDTVVDRAILADGVVAGRVTRFERDGRAELGYWIGREFWGLGVAGRGVGLFLEAEPRRPLHAHVSAANPASIRVLERHGFVRTGQSDEPETERYRAGPVIAFRLD